MLLLNHCLTLAFGTHKLFALCCHLLGVVMYTYVYCSSWRMLASESIFLWYLTVGFPWTNGQAVLPFWQIQSSTNCWRCCHGNYIWLFSYYIWLLNTYNFIVFWIYAFRKIHSYAPWVILTWIFQKYRIRQLVHLLSQPILSWGSHLNQK